MENNNTMVTAGIEQDADSRHRCVATEQEMRKKAMEKLKQMADPRERARRTRKGSLKLETPIRAGGEDITELHFDFGSLSCAEIAEAMDGDAKANNTFRITWKQAMQLFAAAAAKGTEKADGIDILRDLKVQDAIKAVQVTTVFFIACSQAGNERYSQG